VISQKPRRTQTRISTAMTAVAVMAVRCQASSVRSGANPSRPGQVVVGATARPR
jgi:hypothetical protein